MVVDTEETGKLLLERSGLKKRVTIIPLNKISTKTVSEAAVSKARRLVGDANARVALSLVGYERDVDAVIFDCFALL